MKIWKENYREWAGREYDGVDYDQPWGNPLYPSLIKAPEEVLFVRVCSFTFVFFSVVEIGEYLDYYSRKTHPSSILPNLPESGYEYQSKFDRLPLYLREEPKRKQVVKALSAAIAQFGR